MRLLTQLLCKRRYLTFYTIMSDGLSAAVLLWWNWQLAAIINAVSAGKPPTHEMVLSALVAMGMMGAINYFCGYIAGFTSESMTHDLRMGYARYFVTLPFAEIEKLNAGEQISKLQNEITGVSGYLNSNLMQLLGDVVRFVATFCWLLFVSPALTLASNLPSLLLVAYAVWSSKIIGIATGRSQQAKAHMNRHADTLLSLFPIIRLYDAARFSLSRYGDAVNDWERETIKTERKRARLMSLSALLSCLPLLLLFLVGGRMAISGTITVGTLYIFLNLSGNLSGIMMNMPGHIGSFRQFAANMKRLSPYIKLSEKGEHVWEY